MKYSGDYFVTVIEDTRINQIIGSATLVIEHKFIHDCGNVCSRKVHLNSFQDLYFNRFSFFTLEGPIRGCCRE